MSRSVWKGPFVDGYLLKKAETVRASGRNEIIRIWSRRSTILPQFVGLTFGVYNGQKHIPVNVTEDMIGHKFGEFAPTRTFHGHSGDKKAVQVQTGGLRADVGEGETRWARRSESGCSPRARRRRWRRNLRVSPQKLNLLAQLIRGKKVETALAELEFSRKRIAKDVRKCVMSAVANAENNHGLDVNDLVVKRSLRRQEPGDHAASMPAAAAA